MLKGHWWLKDRFKGLLQCTETGSDHRLPDLLSRYNILCHYMVEVSLCHFPLENIMLISYKTLRSVDLLANISVSYYFPFQTLPNLFRVIKHATSKIKPVQNHADTPNSSDNSSRFSIWWKKWIKGQKTVFARVIIRFTSPNSLHMIFWFALQANPPAVLQPCRQHRTTSRYSR